jgi:hypothetical protein
MKNNPYGKFTLDMLGASYTKPNKSVYNPLASQLSYSAADKIVMSGMADNQHRSSFNSKLDLETRACGREVFAGAAKLISQITEIAKQLKEVIGNPQLEAYHNANGILLLQDLGKYYLSQAENALHATRDTRQSWVELGNKYLKYSTYDFMRENKLLPPLIENEEEELMLQELKRQMEKMKLDSEKDKLALLNKDEIIKNQADENLKLTDKLIISEENNRELTIKVEGLTIEKTNLTDKLNISEENNRELMIKVEDLTEKLVVSEREKVVLQEKLTISEAKVVPLQEKVHELKTENKELKEDKLELREDKRMLIEDKKMLQEEKKLLLVDKKIFQDLSQEQAVKITELEQIHCNDPTHINLLHNEFGIIEQVELGGNLNQQID